MRLFISINIDDSIKTEITKIKNTVRNELIQSEANPESKLKWEDESKFHITLFFIGEMPDNALPGLIKGLDRIKPFPETTPMKFRTGGVNAFPNFRYPRVLILDIKDESKKLHTLFAQINEFMKSYGYVSDKPFRPHVTLARVRRDSKANLTSLNLSTLKIPGITFHSDKFTLMESRLSSSGAAHLAVREFEV